MLHKIAISSFENSAGSIQDVSVSFQLFGSEFGTAPIVLVNHALTGNSQVTGENGWWNSIVGPKKAIDTNRFTVLSINIPGNGFDGEEGNLIHNYKEFTLRDIAKLFLLTLDKLDIATLFAIVGGSIGGALAWEMVALRPNLTKKLVPIATDLKATDWVIANCKVQDQILNNSGTPVRDARMHAMTFYRTPQSFAQKFNRDKEENNTCYKVENWLQYHGKQLENRYKLASYKLLNHLLTTIDIGRDTGNYLDVALKIEAKIHLITVNTDWFFL
ncbi:MAG TPA: alpha/beta fold hydrolase, partial [Aequorivita sp.]|nr:alpha/beta fold hydrolase [Aequorivita sp.]